MIDDDDPPLSVYGRGRLVTTIVVVGTSRYGVPRRGMGSGGGSRYCVGVSARWNVVRFWLGVGMARPYGLELFRRDGHDGRVGLFESGIGGVK